MDLTAENQVGAANSGVSGQTISLTPSNSAKEKKSTSIPQRGTGPASTVVCNHIGFCEILALISSPLHCGFAPKEDLKNVPLVGGLARGLQSLFIHRGTDDEIRQKIVGQIAERQRQIEVQNMPYNRLCLFAEGTTTNGTGLMKFKRGAFNSMRTVVPAFIKIGQRCFNPSFDVLDFWPFICMLLSNICFYKFEIVIMPEFTPTQWMLDKHRCKSEQDWEVYAECLREAMAKAGDF